MLRHSPFEVVVLDAVRAETVDAGLAAGQADASAIATAIVTIAVRETPSGPTPVDAVVLDAAVGAGVLITNDLALGRRARNLGARWLRTADFVVLLARPDRITVPEARRAVLALADAGRITSELAGDYLEDLE